MRSCMLSIKSGLMRPRSLILQSAKLSRDFSFSIIQKNIVCNDHSLIRSTCSGVAFGFDIDGVLLRESTPIPGASEALKILQNNNIPFILLTNGGGKNERERAADLSEKLGVNISEENLIQSHTPFQQLVSGTSTQVALENKIILVTGGHHDMCRGVALQYGFKNVVTPADILMGHPNIWPFNQVFTDHYKLNSRPLPLPINPLDLSKSLKIDAIFVFSDPRDWALDSQIILDLLLSHEGFLGTYSSKNDDHSLPNRGWLQDNQPPLYFSNPDLFWAASYHLPRFGQGSFQAALRGVWNSITNNAHLNQTTIGKPCKLTFEYAECVLNKHYAKMTSSEDSNLNEVWFVGDNPLTDIKGANEFKSRDGTKWQSILVTTGVYKKGTNPTYPPNFIASDVFEAVKLVINSKLEVAKGLNVKL